MKKHLRVEGRVQGVGFRYFTRTTAERLGVNGWVRNRCDGSVEAVIEGPDDRVEEMVRELQKGPRASRVDRVSASEIKGEESLEGFEIRD